MHKDVDERRVLDLILAAFEIFPDLSYCLIAFPTQTRFFPLLAYFVVCFSKNLLFTVYSKFILYQNLSTRTLHNMTCPRTKIYLLQRNAFYSPITLSLIHPDDEESLTTYLQSMHNSLHHLNVVFSAARKYLYKEKSVFPIIIRCLDTIIGVCVIQLSV